MDFANDTPFHVGSLSGQVGFPRHSRTFFVKGTFRLRPGEPAAPEEAEEQLRPGGDEHEGGDPAASLRYPSDFAHWKPRSDLLLVGTCHAPGGRAVPECRVTFGVGSFSRSLVVTGDREWTGTGLMGQATPPVPFSRMPLGYERALGGEGFAANPLGRGVGAVVDASGRRSRPLPNLEWPGERVRSSASRGAPAGFGPIPPTWPVRAGKLGTYRRRWQRERWPWFPEDFDYAFYNAAPPEMQLDGFLRGDEPIWLENLHPQHPRYESRLPALRVRCFVLEHPAPSGDGSFREVRMGLDTLWVDADAERLVLVWRGTADVRSEECEEVDAVYFASEPLDAQERPLDHYRARLEAHGREEAEQAEGPPPPEEDRGALAARGMEAMPSPQAAAAQEAELERRVQETWEGLEASGGTLPEPPPSGPGGLLESVRTLFERTLGLPREHRGETARLLSREGEQHPEARDEIEAVLREATGAPEPPAAAAARPTDGPARDAARAVAEGRSLAGADLSGADLSGAELAGADLRDAILTGARLAGADLTRADLTGANLADANLEEGRLAGARMAGADVTDARLCRADLSGADLEGATGERADLTEAVLTNASLRDADLDGATLTAARLDGARLVRAQLRGAVLDGARFAGADLTDATLEGARGDRIDMSAADVTSLRASEQTSFSNSIFQRVTGPRSRWARSRLTGCDFAGAVLPDADFRESHLENVVFDGCELAGAYFAKSVHRGTRLRGANLFRSTLERADLGGADFTGSNLFQAELWQAVVDGAIFDGADLRRTKLA